jgi:hypothetical protein
MALADKHVCKYEPMKEMIEAFLDWADSHTHLTAMGPSSPAQAAATGPATVKVKPKIEPVKSTRVMVGS